jgi:hypothetical protein
VIIRGDSVYITKQVGTFGDHFDSTFSSFNFHTKIYSPWMELLKMTSIDFLFV